LDQGKASKAEELLKRIEGIKKGKEKINLVITDPSGNSAILSDKALVKRGLGTK
jgi:C4-type Zn-finger protein